MPLALQLFQIERELFLGDTVVLDESLLGQTPETLQAVDGELSGGEILAMVHRKCQYPQNIKLS